MLTGAVVAGLCYVISLHPVSGKLGGFIFLLTGWAIPTVINLFVAGWIVSNLRLALWARVCAFVTVSFALGISPSLPRLVAGLGHKSEVSFDILRPVPIENGTKADFWIEAPTLVMASPLSVPITVSGDEGCMCLYFSGNVDNSYYFKAQRLISQWVGMRGTTQTNYRQLPNLLPGNLHFDVRLSQDERAPNTASLRIDVYDGEEITASLTHSGIPYNPSLSQRTSFWENRLANGHFVENTLALLLTANVWTFWLEDYVSYVPKGHIQEFLSQATPKK